MTCNEEDGIFAHFHAELERTRQWDLETWRPGKKDMSLHTTEGTYDSIFVSSFPRFELIMGYEQLLFNLIRDWAWGAWAEAKGLGINVQV
jgi:hypothetical protein